MKLSQNTLELLADIENRISPEVEDDYISQWQNFHDDKCADAIFVPKRKALSTSSITIEKPHINDCIDDYDLMLRAQLFGVSEALRKGTAALGIRANYGTGIMSSLFGAELYMMPRSQNTLPTTRAFADDDKMRELVEKGVPEINAALGKKVFEFAEKTREIFKNYPKIEKYVQIYHPDTQGPLDITELLWGSDIFYNFYDEPELVHDVLDLATDTYIKVMDKWFEYCPSKPGINVHWDYFIKGNICLRSDSAMNISPDLYSEFVFERDKRLFDYYGGGMLHFCGRGDHYLGIISKCDSMYSVNLSQPQYNNMDTIYNTLFAAGKKIIGLTNEASRAYEARPDAVKGMIAKTSGIESKAKSYTN